MRCELPDRRSHAERVYIIVWGGEILFLEER